MVVLFLHFIGIYMKWPILRKSSKANLLRNFGWLALNCALFRLLLSEWPSEWSADRAAGTRREDKIGVLVVDRCFDIFHGLLTAALKPREVSTSIGARHDGIDVFGWYASYLWTNVPCPVYVCARFCWDACLVAVTEEARRVSISAFVPVTFLLASSDINKSLILKWTWLSYPVLYIHSSEKDGWKATFPFGEGNFFRCYDKLQYCKSYEYILFWRIGTCCGTNIKSTQFV